MATVDIANIKFTTRDHPVNHTDWLNALRGAVVNVTASFSTHTGALDPHPQYLTQTEADALYGSALGLTIYGGAPDTDFGTTNVLAGGAP